MDLPRSPEHTDFKRATPVHGSRGPLPFSRPYLSPPPLPLRKYSHMEPGLSGLRTARNLNPGPLNMTPERELHPVDDNITHLIQNATADLRPYAGALDACNPGTSQDPGLTREVWTLALMGLPRAKKTPHLPGYIIPFRDSQRCP